MMRLALPGITSSAFISTVDGGYTDWTEFSECTVSCGGGTQERSRDCTKPKPAHGGRDCEGLGPAKESQTCNTEACPAQTAQDQG